MVVGSELARGWRLLRTPVGLDALRWCGAGLAWDASQADSVRQHVLECVRLAGAPPKDFSQEEAARMLLRSGAGCETASEVAAMPVRGARVSLPARLGDTPFTSSGVVGEEAKKFLSNWEDEMLMSLGSCSRGLIILFLPSFTRTRFFVLAAVYCSLSPTAWSAGFASLEPACQGACGTLLRA